MGEVVYAGLDTVTLFGHEVAASAVKMGAIFLVNAAFITLFYKELKLSTFDEENARLMAGVYASRGLSALVFRGANTGLDELTTTDANQVWLVSGGAVVETTFDARESLGMASASIEDLAGGAGAESMPHGLSLAMASGSSSPASLPTSISRTN